MFRKEILSAGSRQILGLNYTGACTYPANATGIIDGCEFNRLVENSCVGAIAKCYGYDVIRDANVLSVPAFDEGLIDDTSRGIVSRPGTTIHNVLSDCRFNAS